MNRTLTVFAAVVSLLVGMTGVTARGQTMPPCESAPPPVKLTAPAPPANLRIIGGLEWDDELPSGPSAWPTDDESEAPVQTTGTHAYYFALASRSDCVGAYSLRNANQVEQYRASASKAPAIFYLYPNDPDPRRQDAMKILIPEINTSLPTQAHLPLNMSPRTNLFVTWDAWYGKEFAFAHSGIGTYKTFQLGSPGEAIYTEIRTRLDMSGLQPDQLGMVDLRVYASQADGGVGPNVTFGPTVGSRSYGSNSAGPLSNEFGLAAERWTRYFAYFEYKPGPTPEESWYHFSMWMADEQRDPVLMFDGLQIKPRSATKPPVPDINGLWGIQRVEFNSSSSTVPAGRGTLTAYSRNYVMLKGVSKSTVQSLLQRPVK